MNKKRIYFDNAATTPINKKVVKAIKPYLNELYGNPSSVHKEGRMAKRAIDKAKHQVANVLHCFDDEVFFTSGASESNSWVLKSGGSTFTDKDNHDSIELGVYHDERSNIKRYAFSAINNETGENGCSRYVHDYNWVHVDLTQWIGKRKIDLNGFDNFISTASFSAHKFGGLKGCGVLYVRRSFQKKMKPLIYGHQENGMRGGTENVVGIVALGEAIELAYKNLDSNFGKVTKISSYIYEILNEEYLNTGKIQKLTCNNGIINITFNYLNANSAVTIFDNFGVAISAGSACNSGSDEVSKVLINSGYTPEQATNTIRVSISHNNTIKEAKRFCKIFKKIIDIYDSI